MRPVDPGLICVKHHVHKLIGLSRLIVCIFKSLRNRFLSNTFKMVFMSKVLQDVHGCFAACFGYTVVEQHFCVAICPEFLYIQILSNCRLGLCCFGVFKCLWFCFWFCLLLGICWIQVNVAEVGDELLLAHHAGHSAQLTPSAKLSCQGKIRRIINLPNSLVIMRNYEEFM